MDVIGDIKVFLVSFISNTNVLSIGHAYSYFICLSVLTVNQCFIITSVVFTSLRTSDTFNDITLYIINNE